MPSFQVEFEVFCSCGESLCAQSAGSNERYWGPGVTVKPCEKCMENADSEGYDRGYKDGFEERRKNVS